MVIVEAIYQNGVLKPLQDLNLPDNARVRLQVIAAEEVLAESRFKQHLVAPGLLREAKTPSGVLEGDRTPIQVRGKPLSQTIIEERR
ncbi:MAG: antitoxin family protein [Ardenticatenaceae bacterium]|nr:antitoxin family protein [Ardenticatenaceae bacterium]